MSSTSCSDQSFGIQPKDAQLSNLKVNGIAALNKAVMCRLDAVEASITKLKAKMATITNLVATSTNFIEAGCFTVNDCGAPATWTATGSVQKLNGIVSLNLVFIRNAPAFLAPCDPVGTLSCGFAPPNTITVAVSTIVGGIPGTGSVQISPNGNVSAAFAGTTGAGDSVTLITSYAV